MLQATVAEAESTYTCLIHFLPTTSITHPMLATAEAAHSQQCTVFISLSMLLPSILRTFSVEHCEP